MPNKYNRKNVSEAMENAVKEYIELLVGLTPKKTGKMSESWKYKDIDKL